VLLLGSLAIVLFIVVIRFSIEIIGDNQGSWGIIGALGLIQLIQFLVSFKSQTHKKESLIIAGSTIAVGIIAVVVNNWIPVNYNYIAGAVVVLTALFWGITGLLRRYPALSGVAAVALVSVVFIFASDIIF